uniref:Deacetylase sirtuin-type domain-containing protein n=1 Tax=Clastoptera arizonana TaxID=38151 RepID=A0A1B6EG08_9HEMI
MISLHVLTLELYVVLSVKVFAFERMMPHSNDTELFRSMLDSANHVLIITGPGLSLLSTESGVSIDPFEKWRGYRIEEINTYDTFVKNPSLVWEYNNYQRNLMFRAIPNQAHVAIANYERYLRNEGKNRKLTIVTQNVDGLHILAGSSDVIEVEGSIFKTRCLLCGEVVENRDNPICPALKGRGSPLEGNYTDIPKQELPRCKRPMCGGLLRPHLVWFGESLDMKEMTKIL